MRQLYGHSQCTVHVYTQHKQCAQYSQEKNWYIGTSLGIVVGCWQWSIGTIDSEWKLQHASSHACSQLTLSANFNMQVHLHVKKSNRMFSSQLACQRFTCGMFWFITNNHYISLVYRQLAKWKTCIFIYPSQYISNMQGLVQGKIFLGQMFCFSVQHAVQSVHSHTSMVVDIEASSRSWTLLASWGYSLTDR